MPTSWNLTEKKIESILFYKERWQDIAYSTEPMDLEKAIHWLSRAYRIKTMLGPCAYLFYSSPIAGSYVTALLRGHYSYSFRRLCNEMRRFRIDTITDIEALVDRFFDNRKLRSEHRSEILTMSQQEKLSAVLLDKALRVIEPSGAKRELRSALFGSHEAGWLGFYEALRDFGINECKRLTPLIEYAKVGGWAWTYDEVAILTDRPMRFERDDIGRVHSLDGPALAYRDGVKLHAIHGVRVPRVVVEHPELISIEMIEAESNVEVRRVLLDRFGWSRYLNESHCEVIDAIDATHEIEASDIRLAHLYRNGLREARLLRKEIAGDEPLVMVELRNSTPEPDGTNRRYLLRVPPETKTCLEAVAWINYKTADTYRPMVET